MKKLARMLAVLLIPALLGGSPAEAIPVTYDFQGSIVGFGSNGTSSEDAINALVARLPEALGNSYNMFGLPLSGSITIDSSVAPMVIPEPGVGIYSGFGFLSAFSVDFAGFRFTLDPGRDGALARGLVVDGGPDPFDFLGFMTSLGTGQLSGSAMDLVTQLQLTSSPDDSGIISSEKLVADFAALGDFEVTLGFLDPTNNTLVSYLAGIDSFVARATVPDPSTALLFCGGALILVLLRRERASTRTAHGHLIS